MRWTRQRRHAQWWQGGPLGREISVWWWVPCSWIEGLAEYLVVDGFRRGLVAAWIDDQSNQEFDYSQSLSRLLLMPHKRAMIDMPIGLKISGHRICDISARELVGATVFVGARRNLWEFPDQASANEYYWRHEGPGMGVSCQLWNIRDKIKEV